MNARKGQRGRPPGLTRKVIGAAAMEIVEAGGASALTMVRLAERLGVAPSALYNHISGKDQLLVFVQDEVLSQVDTSALAELAREVRADVVRMAEVDGEGTKIHGGSRAKRLRDALEQWARSYRAVLSRQYELIPLIATRPVAGSPNIRNMYEVVARAMLAGGIPERDVVPVIVAFENFLFGAAMDYNAPPTIFNPGPGDVVTPASGRDEAPADPAALIDDSSEAAASLAGQVEGLDEAIEGVRNPYAAVPFEWGLERLLNGVEQVVEDAES